MSNMDELEGLTDDELFQRVADMRATIETGAGRLRAQGIPVDMFGRLSQRLEFLAHCLIGPVGSRQRSLFEVLWCDYLLADQAEAESKAVRARLTHGVKDFKP